MRRLTRKHYLRLSKAIELPEDRVAQLDAMGLIDHDGALNIIMRRDFQKIAAKNPGIKTDDIIKAIANEYSVPISEVMSAVVRKRIEAYFCKSCGIEITKMQYNRSGYCEPCALKQIHFNDE